MSILNTFRVRSLCCVLLVVVLGAGALDAGPRQSKYPFPRVEVRPGDECIICNVPLTRGGLVFLVRGRRVPLMTAMVDSFLDNQEMIFAQLQPRSALFQEDYNAPPGTALGGIGWGWFLAGLYILAGMIFGGLAGYCAVRRDVKLRTAFVLGFLFNLPGLLIVLSKPRKTDVFIPPGLVKVHATPDPVPCLGCGSGNHPSARKCASCGAELTPVVESEVARVLDEHGR